MLTATEFDDLMFKLELHIPLAEPHLAAFSDRLHLSEYHRALLERFQPPTAS